MKNNFFKRVTSDKLDLSTKILSSHICGPNCGCVNKEPHSHPVFKPSTDSSYVDSFQVGHEDGHSAYQQDYRWSGTTISGGGLLTGDATTITWSIIPDGTPIQAVYSGESSDPSNLVSQLNQLYGLVTNDNDYTDEIWFGLFESVFDRWSELSGITYIYEPNDDGAAHTRYSGVAGVRGDVRIGGHNIDGDNGILAYNYYPSNGDMVIDTADSYYNTTTNNSIRLRNLLAHEAGHGLGLAHVESNDGSFLMEAFINTSFDGPQFDDILGAHRGYGDFYEGSNNNQGNDIYSHATDLGLLGDGQTISIGTDAFDTLTEVLPSHTDFVSIDDDSDIDFYSFSIAQPLTIDIVLTPRGPIYNEGPQGGTQTTFNTKAQNDLSLVIFDTDGTSILNSVNNNGIGVEESILDFTLDTSGTYFVRITGGDDAAQMYQLDIRASLIETQNATPQALDDSISTNENITVSGNVLDGSNGGLDTDPDGDSLSVISNTQPVSGTVSIDSNGDFTYTPNADFNGNDSFTYTISDGNGGEDTATVNVTVDAVNDPPQALDDSISTNVNTSVSGNVLDGSNGGLDIDPDGDSLSVISNTQPVSGTVSINSNGDFTYTPNADFNGNDSFTYTISDGNGGEDTATVNVTVDAINFVPNPDSGPNLEIGNLTNVGSDWQTVTLPETYNSMVVIATINYGDNSAPAVARVRNAEGNQFEIKVQNPSDKPLSNYDIHYMVVEEGVYTEEEHGIDLEAVKFTSTTTNHDQNWTGEVQAYQNSYNNPVVLGQVMSAVDDDWSVFWSSGSSELNPPDNNNLVVGKHVGEDNNTTREDELIGYIVMESGQGEIDGFEYVVGVGKDSIEGYDNNPPFDYDLGDLNFTPSIAIVSSSGMDGVNGGWPILWGDNPLTASQLSLTMDEDQVKDTERSHTTEQVSYLVLGSNSNNAPVALDDSYETVENTALVIDITNSVLNNDSDVDGDNLTAAIMNDPSNGTVNMASDGTFTYTPNADFNGTDSFTYTISDGNGGEDTATVNVTVNGSQNNNTESEPKLEVGSLENVGSNWQTVTLSHNYNSMVVVASINYGDNSIPAITRIRNADGNNFEIKVQNPDNITLNDYDVYYTVVEEGVYTLEEHGIEMEAVKINSTLTDHKGSWVGQEQTYENSYTNPVVVGQVMSADDEDWSVFWSSGSSRQNTPDQSNLYVGKHVGEDSDQTRSDELIGYIVIESGEGEINGLNYAAGVGQDSVRGYDNNPSYDYDLSNLSFTPSTGIVSSAGMDGNDGGWSIFYGDNPFSDGKLSLAIDEDQLNDTERSHTTEQVSYFVFDSGVTQTVNAAITNDSNFNWQNQDYLTGALNQSIYDANQSSDHNSLIFS